jgi:hypothetical protein
MILENESESEAEAVTGHISDFEQKIKTKPFLKSTENKEESEMVNSNNKISEMDNNVTSIRKPKPAIIDIGEVQQFVLPTPQPPTTTTTLATTTLSTTTETLTSLKPENSLDDSDEVLKQISFSETEENLSNEG